MSEDRPWVEQAGYGFPWRLKDGSPTVVHYCTCFTLPRLTTDTPLPGVCDTQHPLSCSRRPIPLLQLTPSATTVSRAQNMAIPWQDLAGQEERHDVSNNHRRVYLKLTSLPRLTYLIATCTTTPAINSIAFCPHAQSLPFSLH